jgi:hypothetical protein
MYGFHRLLQSASPLRMQVLVVSPVQLVQMVQSVQLEQLEQQGWLERLERPGLLEQLEPLVCFAVIRLQRKRLFLRSAVQAVENSVT